MANADGFEIREVVGNNYICNGRKVKAEKCKFYSVYFQNEYLDYFCKREEAQAYIEKLCAPSPKPKLYTPSNRIEADKASSSELALEEWLIPEYGVGKIVSETKGTQKRQRRF